MTDEELKALETIGDVPRLIHGFCLPIMVFYELLNLSAHKDLLC